MTKHTDAGWILGVLFGGLFVCWLAVQFLSTAVGALSHLLAAATR